MDPYEPILISCLYVVCGMLFGFDSKLVNNREALKAIGTVDQTRHVSAGCTVPLSHVFFLYQCNIIINVHVVPQPGGFYLPKNEKRYDPMHFDLEVIWRSTRIQVIHKRWLHFLWSRRPLYEIPQVSCLSRSGVIKSVLWDGLVVMLHDSIYWRFYPRPANSGAALDILSTNFVRSVSYPPQQG